MGLTLPVGVAYGTDPDHVERVLVDETRRAAAEVAGLLADPPPQVRLIPGFGPHSLDFTLACQVGSFVDQYLVQHELRKRILRRFEAEGIRLPDPVRTVELRGAEAPPDGTRRPGPAEAPRASEKPA